MIINGKSRAGARQLAASLQRLADNDRIQILEHNSPHAILAETFRDWEIIGKITQGTKSLYHAQIKPAAGYRMTPDQWVRAADVLERELGLTGQPRAIVLHEKDGHALLHVVWQRCDIDTMTLISDSWNYRTHEKASLALELEFGHEHVPGRHTKRILEGQPEFLTENTSHSEQQQAERSGINCNHPGETTDGHQGKKP